MMSSTIFDKAIIQDNEIKILKDTIKSLEEQNQKLKKQNKSLRSAIERRNEESAETILEYFANSNSIRDTAWFYGIDMEELFELIPEWDGCRDGLQGADDYHGCRLEVLGRALEDEEKESCMTNEELEERMRTPDDEEVVYIIKHYNDNKLTLYEIADRFDIKIENLFYILKENKVIEKETDVNDYKDFYTEYHGTQEKEWDGKSEIGLIEEFYKIKSTVNNV